MSLHKYASLKIFGVYNINSPVGEIRSSISSINLRNKHLLAHMEKKNWDVRCFSTKNL